MLKLAYIGGLGLMASPAARHLVPGGPARVISVLDRGTGGTFRNEARDAWRAHGALLVSNAEQLFADRPDILVICAGKNGDDLPLVAQSVEHFKKAKLPGIILHMSTVSAGFVRAAFSHAAGHGVAYVNYPLTGGPTGAQLGGAHPNGMLILSSGAREIYDRLEPMLKLLGRPRYFGARPEAGALVKLIGQHLVFNGCIGITSAAALYAENFTDGVLQGTAQTEFFDFLNSGAGGTRQWDVGMKKGVGDGVWNQGFMIKHAAVDAVYAAEAAMTSGLSRLSVEPMLNIGLAFSYLLHRYAGQELATHAVAREILKASSPDLDEFLIRHRVPGSLDEQLQAVIASFPEEVRRTVALGVKF